jgi:AraC-like DNA-binding protein
MERTRSTHGIINPIEGLQRFRLDRFEPGPELAPYVDWYWVVSWNLPDGAPAFEQEVLPHPCVNLAIEARGSAVHGVFTRRTRVLLKGCARVVAAKFVPAGFEPFASVPMVALRARIVPLAQAFGEGAAALVSQVLACADDERAARHIEAFLRERMPRTPDASRELATQLVAHVTADRTIRQAEDLAGLAGLSVRSLNRLFRRYVGVGPKWVIQRARVHEAAERVALGAVVEWPRLAQELGYHDQAHLIRDFKAQIGFTPAVYAKRCAAARVRQPEP